MNRLVIWVLAAVLAIFAGAAGIAHPMPNSLLVLDVFEDRVVVQAHIPVTDLELASGLAFGDEPSAFVAGNRDAVANYLQDHTAALTPQGVPWTVSIGAIAIDEAQTDAGIYAEFNAGIVLTPPPGAATDRFSLAYDAVVHQVVTHAILVSIRQDWMNGRLSLHGEAASQIGVIDTNTVDGSISPLTVDLSQGSYATGFVHMLQLGMSHIAAGTDHLLFLMALLLPAPLVAAGGVWRGFAGTRASVLAVLKIVTAFTFGHSATLIVAGLTRVELPQQPIEVIIALTIMMGAIHALRPLFPGKEAYIAGIFGLIHGMAFSFTLADLTLSTPQLVLSLLGLNLGIELIQIAIVLAVMPALLMLAKTGLFAPVRIAGALLALVAAAGWAAARMGRGNPLAAFADDLGGIAPYAVAGLTVIGLVAMLGRDRTGLR